MNNVINYRNITTNASKIQNAHKGNNTQCTCKVCGNKVSKSQAVFVEWAGQPYYAHPFCGGAKRELQGLTNVDGIQWRLLLDTAEGRVWDAEAVAIASIASNLHQYQTKANKVRYISDWRGNFCKLDVLLEGIEKQALHTDCTVHMGANSWKHNTSVTTLVRAFRDAQGTFSKVTCNVKNGYIEAVASKETRVADMGRDVFLLKAVCKVITECVEGKVNEKLAVKRIARAVEMDRMGIATYQKRK